MGRKYGTLTPEQQSQYVDAISQLYSHPRHAGTLMEKLRKAVHPNGAVSTPATLKPATPEGGTAQADDQLKVATEKRKEAEALSLAEQKAQIAAKYHKPAGKSPPVPGTQLPPDAVGADGQPLGQEARTAGNSFVEWNGSWWPVAKPKPVLKTIQGHMVLVDPQSGSKLRDLGAVGATKVTTRQTLQPGDDGQMHLVNLTSVTAPGGENIEVDPQQSETPETGKPKEGEKPSPAPAKKPSVGGVLPKTKPVSQAPGGPSAGKVVPGLSGIAERKLETTQDRQVLESSKQIISSIDDLLPILEKRKNQGGVGSAIGQRAQFEAYKHGIQPSDPDLTKIFENSALLSVIGASLWSRIGRSKYTFEVIQQHLPQPTDTPSLMYDKVKWLKDNVVPAAQEAIKNPQPDAQNSPKVLKYNESTGRLE
jgi:hypothetical protein